MRLSRRELGWWLILAAGGCAGSPSAPRLRLPKVTIAGLDGLSITGSTLVARVRVRVSNPNPFPVRIERVDYRLDVDERATGDGATTQTLEIPAHGEAVAPMVLQAPLRNALAAGVVLLLAGEVRYRLDVNLHFWTPVGPVAVPARDEGTVKLGELLPGADPAPSP